MNLKRVAIASAALSFIVQIILILWYDGQPTSDSATYLGLAQAALNDTGFYPAVKDTYASGIVAPGWVNFLVLVLAIFGSAKFILFMNVVMNFVVMFEIFYICKKLFGERTSLVAVILWACYISNYGLILYITSEELYLPLVLGALCVYLKDKAHFLLLAGCLAALANWVRPFLPVLILVVAGMTMFIKKEQRLKSFGLFMAGLALTVGLIGWASYANSGYFIFQSYNAGGNLIMGANDDADGSYDVTVFDKGKIGYFGDLQGKTFVEIDGHLMKQAVDWIKEHPWRYISLFPKKLFYMYAHDLHSLSSLTGDTRTEVGRRSYIQAMLKDPLGMSPLQVLLVVNQLYYMLLMIGGIAGLYIIIRKKDFAALSIASYWILGTAMTLLVVGASRYHQPYMPIVIILTAHSICHWGPTLVRMRLKKG